MHVASHPEAKIATEWPVSLFALFLTLIEIVVHGGRHRCFEFLDRPTLEVDFVTNAHDMTGEDLKLGVVLENACIPGMLYHLLVPPPW